MNQWAANDDDGLPQVAILFAQFAAYHVDRVEAVARRLESRARVLAVEGASTSTTYAWEAASGFDKAKHITLFPGRPYEDVSTMERLRGFSSAVRNCDFVFSGLAYSEPCIIALSWRLRAAGRQIVVLTESKFDDQPRNLLREQAKARVLSAYRGAVVGGLRQRDYLRFLGFDAKPVLAGYDTVGVERLRKAAGAPTMPWRNRDFIFVGRFVEKKNIATLLDGFARYRALAGPDARRLVLAGDGPLAQQLRAQAASLGMADEVDFAGFLDAPTVARRLAGSLALVLPSIEEQWGLVVNEATALGIPSIVSSNVGSRDALVRNGVCGFVVEPQSADGLAQAMLALSQDEETWQRHARAASTRAWLADTERFADAVELMFDPAAEAARANIERFWNEVEFT